MPVIFLKKSTGWTKIQKVYVKKNGNWTALATAYLKKAGVWVKVFLGAGPSVNSSPTITPRLGGKTFDIYDSTNGSWDGATTFTRQWVRSDEQAGPFVNIGVTSSSYTTTSNDDGKWITVTVSASDGVLFNEANATPVQIIKYAPVSLTSTGGYSLSSGSNSPSVGQVLTIVKGTDPDWKVTTDRTNDTLPDPSLFEYEWKWNDTGAPITDATSSTYTVRTSDLTHTIAARIKAVNTGGSTYSAWSSATGIVSEPVVIETMPSITTTGKTWGDTLTGNTGTYLPVPDEVYWMWQYYNTDTSSWTPIYNSSGNVLGNPASTTDTSQNQNHTTEVPSRFYSDTGLTSVTSTGKLIRFVSSAGKGTAYSPTYASTSLGPIIAVTESVANRVPTASSNIYRRVDGFWTAFGLGTTNATINWVNTRLRNTGTGGTATHTFFTTNGADLTTDFHNDIGGTGLTQTSYRFGVQAIATGNYSGNTLYSIGTSDEGAYSENTSNINPQFPSRPTGFTATRISNSRIDLAWNAAGGSPTNYQLYYQLSDYSDVIDKTTPFDFELGNVTSSQRTGLSGNTLYWWWVRSKNATGLSNWSAGASATTDPNPTTTTTTTTTTAAPTTTTTTTTTAAPTTTTTTTTTTTAAPTTTTTTTAAPTPVFTTSTPSRSRSGTTLSMSWTYTMTNVSFAWWNTRLRNTGNGNTAKHTLFSETPTSDSYTSVNTGTFVLGVQGRGYYGPNATAIYTIGTTDEGSYRESSSISVP